MSGLKIINPGLLTTVQDHGRHGWLKYGVPTSGAMDTYALHLANILVDNSAFEAGLEMTAIGATVEFEGAMAIALAGADMNPMLNGNPVDRYKTLYVCKGDVLSFGTLKTGMRAYMAVSGGLSLPSVMGSKATYLRGGFGGFEGRKLQAGDILKVNSGFRFEYFGDRCIPADMIPDYQKDLVARVILGTEEECFEAEGVNTFLRSGYTVSSQSDRMGIRLQGAPVSHIRGADIISGPIAQGAIQVPADGQPIILMADCQSTGGYTKIAGVISVDLPYIAQLRPGDLISFKTIDMEEAHSLLTARENKLEALVTSFLKQKQIGAAEKVRNFSIRISGRLYNVSIQELE